MIAGSRFVVHDPAAQKGKWHEVFGNDHPIHIEIGMGKGRFMMDLAAANPGIDYVGIEKYSTVLLRAVQKMEMQELANLRLVRMEAEELCEVFDRGDREDLSEFFGSMAEGQARQEAASVAPVPGAVSRDPGSGWTDRVQDGQCGSV